MEGAALSYSWAPGESTRKYQMVVPKEVKETYYCPQQQAECLLFPQTKLYFWSVFICARTVCAIEQFTLSRKIRQSHLLLFFHFSASSLPQSWWIELSRHQCKAQRWPRDILNVCCQHPLSWLARYTSVTPLGEPLLDRSEHPLPGASHLVMGGRLQVPGLGIMALGKG